MPLTGTAASGNRPDHLHIGKVYLEVPRDTDDGPERKRLQSKAGYIDARPRIPQLEEVLLQRTAGPYIRVRSGHHAFTSNVRFAPESGHSICAAGAIDFFKTTPPFRARRR